MRASQMSGVYRAWMLSSSAFGILFCFLMTRTAFKNLISKIAINTTTSWVFKENKYFKFPEIFF